MQQLADWYFALVFFVTLLGFVVAGILYFINKTDTFSSRLLAGFLVCICILLLNNGLMATRFFLNFPHFWRVAVFASFCFQAFGYLYVKSVLQQAYRFKKTDYLFFLPALLYTLTWIPFYSLPASEKLVLIEQIITNNALIAKEPENILPAGVGILSRTFFGMGISVALYIKLFRWKKNLQLAPQNNHQNLDTYRWLFYFTTITSLLYLISFILIVFQLTVYFSIWHTVIFAITCTILFIVGFLLRKPSILYGMTGWLQQPLTIPENAPNDPVISSKSAASFETPRNSLSLEQGLAYKQLLENHFNTNLPFLKGGYTMSNLSSELLIPTHQLSAFINQEYGKNFNELINSYRVDYLESLVKSSSEYQFESFF